jgi:TatA/E family protein of Tat protein translocase
MPDLLVLLIVLLLIVLLTRGAKTLPQLGTGLGQMIRGFRDEVKDRPHDQDGPKPGTPA